MNTTDHTSAIKVIAFAFTGYPVTDLPRARAFYEGVLGLAPAACWLDDAHGWIEYDLGEHTLAITNGAPNWKPGSDGPSIALEVENFDSCVADLKRRGIRFVLEPIANPTCRLAVILDPDGNAIAIHKRAAELPAEEASACAK